RAPPPATHPLPYTTLFRSPDARTVPRRARLSLVAVATEAARRVVPGLAPLGADHTARAAPRAEPLPDQATDASRSVEEPSRPHRSEEHTSELQSRFDIVCR